jgi:hypothetical protein
VCTHPTHPPSHHKSDLLTRFYNISSCSKPKPLLHLFSFSPGAWASHPHHYTNHLWPRKQGTEAHAVTGQCS